MNEGLYCLVNIPTADTVVQGPQILPQNYQAPNGTWYYNINNEDIWPDAQLITIGWYPYVLVDTGSPGPYYTRSLSGFNVQAANVTQTAIYTQWPIEQVRAIKNGELEQQITEYTANEVAAEPKISEYVANETEWLFDQQAELARLEVWQDVADFDTTKPEILPLSNDFVGRSYVTQGEKLSTENTNATNAGLAEPWDSVAVADFITANKLAGDDISGNTPPVQPTYVLRQGIAVPSEEFNRVTIYRYQQPNANPALQTNYRMVMTNRQDARDLYIFSYTNGTYLTWHKFEDQGNGKWQLEGHSAEWQYVPADMGFIFSYGTNPAVEADFFTERVEFEAGIAQKNILVAWDKV